MKRNLGFTLIELLVVIGILMILLSVVLIAINPFRQFSQANDLAVKAAVYDMNNAAGIYFASEKAYPWEKNDFCKAEVEAGGQFSNMAECIKEMTGFDKVDLSENEKDKFSKIEVNKCKDQAVMCYLPSTKEVVQDAIYDKYGVVKPGCPEDKDKAECYWCKRIKTDEVCKGGPTESKWGMAVSMHGYPPALDPNYPNSTIPNEEVIHRDFTPGMEINSPSLTVEAWIKPEPPVPLQVTHTINQSIFQLTLDSRWEGESILYEYYFTVLQTENGCGRTVVYSGGRLIDRSPMTLGHILETPEEFNTWKHIAGVLDGKELRIYSNGKHMSTYTVSNNFTVCNNHTKDLNIGAFSTPYNYMGYYNGLIDEMRISTIPRYDGDYTIPSGPFSADENTMYLYHFDGDTKDSSRNGFDAQIIKNVRFVDSDIPY